MKRLSCLLIAIAFYVSGCVHEKESPNVEKDIAAVKAVYERYCEYVTASDYESFISLWAENGARIEPDILPITGIEAVKERFKDIWKSGTFRMNLLGETQVEVREDMAYALGAVSLHTE